jgi:integrase
MSKRKKNGRVYWRGERAWGDFREYSDVGGGLEALRPAGERFATRDADVAMKLASARVEDLETRRRSKSLLGLEAPAELARFAAYYLERRARTGNGSERWLAQVEKHLTQAAMFFGAHVTLDAIGVRDVRRYLVYLQQAPSSRGGTISSQTRRHRLMALSGLFEHAQSEARVPAGYNPVRALSRGEIPGVQSAPARWLEAPDVSLLLEAARTYNPPKDKHAINGPTMHALLATFALSGARKAEVLGLLVRDISFDHGTIAFRPNEYRGLKTSTSHRQVRLWPQLHDVLQDYIFAAPRAENALLFPSVRHGGMITDFDKSLDAVAARAGWEAGKIRSKMLRHSYAAARLQTLEHGAPIQPWIVSHELGHGSRGLVDRVYGHVSHRAPRGDVVEFNPDAALHEMRERAATAAALASPSAAASALAEADRYEARLRQLRLASAVPETAEARQ